MEPILSVLNFIWTLFVVIMVFNFMILVHEWGHFLAGRWRGLVVDRFQIWFGKPLWKKEINGVQYGLGSIPFGGFVSLPQMVDMEGIEGKVDDEKKEKLPPITPLDKIIVAFAGPLFSFALACVFAVLAWGLKYPQPEFATTTYVGSLAPGGAAEAAGIKQGDRIKSVDGVEIEKFFGMGNTVQWQVVAAEVGTTIDVVVERDGEELTLPTEIKAPEVVEIEGGFVKKFLAKVFARPPLPSIGIGSRISPIIGEVKENSPADIAGFKRGDQIIEFEGKKPYVYDIMAKTWTPGEPVTFKVKRYHKELDLTVVPRPPEVWEVNAPRRKPMLGIGWDGNGVMDLKRESPVVIITDGAKSIYKTLQKVFSPKSSISGSHLSGAVGIGRILFEFLSMEHGWKRVVFFGALLNVNLAILNLLPFPVLDGGHIVMATTEWIRKKPIPVKFLLVVQNLFVYLLFGFMIFITFKDVGDFGNGGAKKEKPEKVEWTAPKS